MPTPPPSALPGGALGVWGHQAGSRGYAVRNGWSFRPDGWTTKRSSQAEEPRIEKITKSESEWRSELSPEEYRVLREAGTEPAFSGAYWDTKETGVYRCRACGQELFRSETKFDSGTGWPSFFDPMDSDAVETRPDNSFFMRRTEVVCSRCGSHLGHVFEDGPDPTGLRYCINSCSLELDSD